MQSDQETGDVLSVFERQTTAFRSALALAVEDVRSALASRRQDSNGTASAEATELGEWAAQRIDIERFAALMEQTSSIDSDAAAHIEAAFSTLSNLSSRGDALFRVRVATGANLRDAVATAYEDIGRAFGAARVFEAARSGAFDEKEHGTLLDGLRFRRWSEAERRLAPPLVVGVDGGDLFVSALAEFLDGNTKIVLHIRGDCPPAPLVRLITAGTYVTQTIEAAGLAGLACFDGPGIGALVPEYAAHFTHDPSAGRALGERLHVEQVPVEAPRTRIGGYSATQQVQDLDQLHALVTRPTVVPPVPPPAAEGADAADAAESAETTPASAEDDVAGSLAAWLLQQAGLGEGN